MKSWQTNHYDSIERSVVERVDVKDSLHFHTLNKRKVKVVYEEWHIGKRTWYNEMLDEYKVEYKENNNYIKPIEFNGTGVIILDQ